jgi:putative ABC transport system substrate-binding protein
MSTRREFITLLGGAAAMWPLAARAQQAARQRRVGILLAFAESDREFQENVGAFRQEIRRLGWPEESLRIDERWAADDMERVRAYASELINLKPVRSWSAVDGPSRCCCAARSRC